VETIREMGHEARVVDPLDCYLHLGRKAPSVYYRDGKHPIRHYDVIIPRIGASITEYGLAVVNQFDMMGVPLINNSQPIARSRDKLRSLQLLTRHDVDIPRTVIARNPEQIRSAIRKVGGIPVILKLIRGTQGVGVMLAEKVEQVESIIETVWNLGQDILIQEFVKESEGKDIRALVVGDRVVAAMRREAQVGEFRANIHRGSGATALKLPPPYERAALMATRVMGLQVAGVDLLESRHGPKVMEINSSPGFEGLEAATGIDVARTIVEYAVIFAEAHPRNA
jgi:ribosomal protein S6--L-glutamate ligase